MKYMIDEKAFKEYLHNSREACKTHRKVLENAEDRDHLSISFVKGQLAELACLEVNTGGVEGVSPAPIENGGFMKPVTNIRAAVNNMTDEELAEVLSPIFTLTADGKLIDCDGSFCTLCPAFEFGDTCKEGIIKYMLKEAE